MKTCIRILIVSSAVAVAALTAGASAAKSRHAPLLPAYVEECGSCHVAFPGRMLGAASWRAVLEGLEQHFGVDASVDAKTLEPIRAYASLLHVLLRNLVDNAIRYGAGGSAVRVEIGRTASHAVLRVVDQGPGIPAAERSRVLDRFYRGLGTGESGAGLGLAIAARIAALHGAALELDEGPGGRGLAATLRWPIPGTPA